MVTRIAYKYNDWRTNTLNNTQDKKRACILTADGSKLYYSADKANLYGNGKNSIASLKLISGSAKNIGITNITKNDDGSFKEEVKTDATTRAYWDDKMYLFPIAQSEILKSGGALTQNPGW
jgi:hypothetical protein